MTSRRENLETIKSLLDYAVEFVHDDDEAVLAYLLKMALEEVNTVLEHVPEFDGIDRVS